MRLTYEVAAAQHEVVAIVGGTKDEKQGWDWLIKLLADRDQSFSEPWTAKARGIALTRCTKAIKRMTAYLSQKYNAFVEADTQYATGVSFNLEPPNHASWFITIAPQYDSSDNAVIEYYWLKFGACETNKAPVRDLLMRMGYVAPHKTVTIEQPGGRPYIITVKSSEMLAVSALEIAGHAELAREVLLKLNTRK